MSIGHLLNREVEIWRHTRTPDGAGGWFKTLVFSHTEPARISRANVSERSFSRSEVGDMQASAELKFIIYFNSDASVRRGDRVFDVDADAPGGGTNAEYRVFGAQLATNPDVYLRVEAELIQPEQTGEES